MSLAGKDRYLRSGLTWVCLKWERNTPKLSDKCIILVKEFNRNVGRGLKSQDLSGKNKISLETSVREAGLNTVQGWCTTGKSILQLEAQSEKEA